MIVVRVVIVGAVPSPARSFEERTRHADPADGYSLLAAAVLLKVASDLQDSHPRRRADVLSALHC